MSDSSDGQTVSLVVGQHLEVTLHSTYWNLHAPADPHIIVPIARPSVSRSTTCPSIPGTGCGLLTEHYVAIHVGVTTISATRGTCGEALACRPDQSSWRIRVEVR